MEYGLKAIPTRLTVALLTLISGAALAADVDIKTPWVRGTVAGQQASGAFMEITSKAGATIVGANSPLAAATEIHEMKMDGSVMKMRAVPRLELPAGKPVKLEPGSYHVMLMGLKQPLKKGDAVPLSIRIEGQDKTVETIEIKAEVRDLTSSTPATHGHHH